MNKSLNKSFQIIIVIFSFIFNVHAQKEIGNETPEVKVIAHVTKKTIMLRWGVTTSSAWKFANKEGYIIERKTIVVKEQILSTPIVKILNTTPIKPKPMMEWKEFTEKNNYAAIAAQALYGEQFDVEMNEGGNGIMSILNQAQAIEQRFSFALYAADQNFEVAKYSGLAYIDKDVKENERYLYTIRIANQNPKRKIKSGGVYLGLVDYKPLPKPQEFAGIFKDKTAMLSWNFSLLKKYYNNYIIERSDDNGSSYKSLTNTPVTNLGEREVNPSNRMMYIDSLFQNNKIYKYRIKGISAFGMEGPYSNIISGKGITPLKAAAYITTAKLTDDGSVIINWEFPQDGITELKWFKLVRSDTPKGIYSTVASEISKNKRSYKVANLKAINYFKIVAIGYDNGERKSFPKMVQPDDSTPPAVPVEIIGKIDSLGVVRLNWKLNTEIDFLGYRVFRSNFNDDEFTQITFKPTPNNYFIDTINIKTLNKKIFYKVQSFDRRYNPSNFSEVLALKRPDIVPPTQPIFSSFKAEKGKVVLKWVTSSSNDAKSTMLYRKEKGVSTSWELISNLALPENNFTDTTVEFSKTYLYTLLTVDDSGLESEPITPLKITISDDMAKPVITKFEGAVNRETLSIELKWSYKEPNVVEYIIYKASEGKQPTMFKIFEGNVNKHVDKELTINTKYVYLLQAIFKSGAKSPIKKIELNY
ncbi:fibronectin type III domain-containing protein [Tenacibaculum finnmarkense]|uniref:fibronectin type III domain-containing protein n=1 Tax=Tenacibaculum finnmarkense TaxID=2781243 RepID=UPI001EFA49B7|nr:hypothetical protein [Tenacibaculum finnmarkense]MCG8207861.1 hypothetical protein [Tenacibaculum finnmarkense genomovar finnmarkense]MCG8723923.1 hypothetical protein [Tenacibaculum finnmarkense]MCG8765628.1 hypothetical protein [Tenacibaculum finnmarkense]MCG8778556.1 hypothetical protein [Tenacibaculum finnmarkense]MCM8907047.1 hypothetical protein [Tenacibaculum finnmarkense genomovar finnmarkense]